MELITALVPGRVRCSPCFLGYVPDDSQSDLGTSIPFWPIVDGGESVLRIISRSSVTGRAMIAFNDPPTITTTSWGYVDSDELIVRIILILLAES